MFSFLHAIAAWRPVKSEAGVTAIEYGLIAALIAVAIIAGITLLGTQLNTTFSTIASRVSGAGP